MIPIRWQPRLPADAADLRALVSQARLYFGIALDPRQRKRFRTRERLAARFLRGRGLEIGALHSPLRLPAGATARYVDRMPLDRLRETYHELSFFRFPRVDFVADGERLACLRDAAVDFVVASHVIEHCRDPIGTLRAWLRVLRGGGVLFLIVPARTNRYDRDRPLTSLDHVVRDYLEGPAGSQPEHYAEHARLTLRLPEAEITPERIRAAVEAGSSIHQHVWSPESFAAMLEHCRAELGFGLHVEASAASFEEFVVVARKTGRA